MVDPTNREFAGPYNRYESEYLKRTDFEVRARFIEASFGNMESALALFNEQQHSLELRSGLPNRVEFYQFVQDSLPTEQDESNEMISMPTVAYRLVDSIAKEENVEFNEELEVHFPTKPGFVLGDPSTHDLIVKDQVIIKQIVNDGGKKRILYYFAWNGGFGLYEPVSANSSEHAIEFAFFKEHSKSLKLNDLTVSTVIELHKKLVDFSLWYFSKTDIDLSGSQSA